MYKKLPTVIAPGRKAQRRVEKRFYLSLVPFVQFKRFISASMGFPGGSDSKEGACSYRSHGRLGFDSWIGKIPWKWEPTPELFFFFFKQLITFFKISIEKMELGSIVPGELLVSPEEECSMG